MANQYNDTQLQKLFTEMDVKHRKRALKGAFRREANQVRRTAINNLRSSLHSNRDLEKGIRAIVFKKAAGFRVTIGTKKANPKTGKGEKGMHINRQGLKKPVDMGRGWNGATKDQDQNKGFCQGTPGPQYRTHETIWLYA